MKANVHRSLTRLHAFSLLVLLYLVLVAGQSTAQTAADWVLRYETPGEYDSPTDIAFLDDDHAIVTINHGVLVTTDGGATWQVQAAFPFDPDSGVYWITWTDIDFADPLHGWMAGGKGGMARTTDGGETWEEFDEARGAEMYSVAALSADLCDITGRRMRVLFDGFLPAGVHTLTAPHINPPPGMHVIRFHTNDGVQLRKLPVMP